MLSLNQGLEIKESILAYLRATFTFQDKEVDEAFDQFLTDPVDGIFKGPYVSIKLPFVKATPEEQRQVPIEIQSKWPPYRHQLQAWHRLSSKDKSPQPSIITTGTGSGKTEAFLYPLLDHCYRHLSQRGIKAIIMYPMNALATDQAKRLAEAIYDDEKLRGKVTAGLFIGEGQNETAYPKTMSREHIIENRNAILASPPDILLTNFKMLDYALMKQNYQSLWQYNRLNADLLQYLVLDELHTYDGAQGTDVANLIRRVKLKLRMDRGQLCPIGTSATIGAGENSKKLLAEFASKVYGEDIDDSAIIGEERIKAAEFFSMANHESFIPRESKLQKVKPIEGEGYDSYLARQMQYWQIEDPEELPSTIQKTLIVKDICQILEEAHGIKLLSELQSRLSDRNVEFKKIPERDEANDYSPREALIYSLLSLMAEAKVQDADTGRKSPFVFVQVQVWIRELSGVLRSISEQPKFVWREQSESMDERALPPWFCRECGASGWLALKHENKTRYEKDINNIYTQYFKNDKNIHFANLTAKHSLEDAVDIGYELTDSLQKYVHQETLEFGNKGQGLDITAFRKISSKGYNEHVCPECNTQNNIAIIGTRIATLSSVSVSQSLASDLDAAVERDRKILAFTNSVQDAAHQAGFIQARNYRFTFRSSLQRVINLLEEGVSLSKLATEFKAHWKTHNDGSDSTDIGAYYYRFYPKDQIGKSTPENFKTKGQYRADFKSEFDLRMDWEAISEFGYNAVIGRTLEKTGASVAYIKDEHLAAVFAMMQDWLVENDTSTSIAVDNFKDFLQLVLYRLRVRGAVSHTFLRKFRSEKLSLWNLNWNRDNRHFLNPGFSPRARFPKVVTTQYTKDSLADSTYSKRTNWFHHFFIKSFPLSSLSVDYINEFYVALFDALEQVQVVDKASADGVVNYALNPDLLAISKHIHTYQCTNCNHKINTSQKIQVLDGKCINYRCKGTYEELATPTNNYYQKVYNRKRAPRVYAADHTGLLDRQVREELEDDFKYRPNHNSKNVLVATSTLEMGIDIGSLNTAYNNEVPPQPSNFLQRVGRAGRASGSALIINFVKNQSHDLYYFQDPLEMMDGEINTPGCFIDAKEILRRHFFAYIIDNWVLDEENQIPSSIKLLSISSVDPMSHDFFMNKILTYFHENQDALLDRFFKIYQPDLKVEVQTAFAELIKQQSFTSFYQQIFIDVKNEIIELSQQRIQIDKIQKEQKLGDSDPERASLEQEKKNLGAIINSVKKRQILEHLTNVGALPNYAFPETGTTLNARIVGGRSELFDNEFSKDIEIVRSSAQALREFAPDNSFYSQGFELKVSGVNTFDWSKADVFHQKRFCSNCDHIAVVSTDSHSLCPKCGDQSWSSESNKQSFAKLTTVKSFNYLQNATVRDSTDDREQIFYNTVSHFDLFKSKSFGSYNIEEIPFGIELLSNVTYTNTNLGRQDVITARKVTINESEVPKQGFVTCRTCGKSSSNPRQRDYKFHYPYCKNKEREYKDVEDDVFKEVFFFREFNTEVVKVLLPIQEINTSAEINMFKSSIQLGLKHYYNGNPSHIKIESYSEHNEITGKFDNYLLMIDTIPGGTGYLTELFDWDTFISILRSAYDKIKSCSCQYRGLRGCYKCIYSYDNQYIQDELDRSVIEERLAVILKVSATADFSSNGLNKIANKGRIEESELEVRFVHLLKQLGIKDERYEFREVVEYGIVLYYLEYKSEALKCSYKIQPQVNLGSKDEVAYNTRTDFLFTCVAFSKGNEAIDVMHFPRIAIYLDGYHFHASQEHNRFENDLKIRNSIRNSPKVCSWTLTWEDLSLFEIYLNGMEDNEIETKAYDDLQSLLLKSGYSETKQKVQKIFKGRSLEFFGSENSVLRLLKVLNLNGQEDDLMASVVLYLASFQKKSFKPSYGPDEVEQALDTEPYSQYCLESKTIDGLLPFDLSELKLSCGLKAATNLVKKTGVSKIQLQAVEQIDKKEWQSFWVVYNLVQFYREVAAKIEYDANEILEYFEEPLKSVVRRMVEANQIQSEKDELLMEGLYEKGRVVASAMLVLHQQKIAIEPLTYMDRKLFIKAEYEVLTVSEAENIEL